MKEHKDQFEIGIGRRSSSVQWLGDTVGRSIYRDRPIRTTNGGSRSIG